MCGHRSRTPYPSEGEIVVCVEKARLVHRLQHLAAQEDHVRRQPAARSDPAPHPHRIHRIQHHGCFAISDGATVGAETVVDYTSEDFTTRPERYDLVFNAVGKRKATLQCEGALTPGGKHMTVDDGLAKLRMEDLVLLKELVEAGSFKPVIDRTYSLEEMVEAHRYVEKGHKKGNVVISVAA